MTDPISVPFVRDPIAAATPSPEATGSVTYRSAGACLVIGELEAALAALAGLPSLSCSVFVPVPGARGVQKRLLETGVTVFTGDAPRVDGHLGDFTATAGPADAPMDLAVATWRESGRFDLVLDLGGEPVLGQRLPPPGYVHLPPGTGTAMVRSAMESLDSLVGEFDKPRYFRYRPDICAHSRSSLTGCSRCLDVCAAGAIVPAGEGVSIDPYLCQGCGSCATVCPTGAMRYAYPALPEAIERTRASMRARPVDTLLLHVEDDEPGLAALGVPGNVLSLVVEEVGAFGLDYWLTTIAGGISRIVLIDDSPEDDPGRRALEQQAALLHRLLGGLDGSGVSDGSTPIVACVPLERLAKTLEEPGPLARPGRQAAAFSVTDDKRGTVRAALDTLCEHHPPREPVLPLPGGSPFGRIAVDPQACTLCMACVSTCPAGALLDGRDTPALRMIEANCVQCGLCEQACPEQAITLDSRYVWDSVEARRAVTLNAEEPFHCVRCHKAFATRRLIDTMTAKLADHWMFRESAARKRLRMCEDCRVKDLFEHEPDGPDVHRGAASPDGGNR